jgi:hypothetical protein
MPVEVVKFVLVRKDMQLYNAHETERMHQVHGAQLASFKARGAAFVIDFLVAFLLFLVLLILGVRLGSSLGLSEGRNQSQSGIDLHHGIVSSSLSFILVFLLISATVDARQVAARHSRRIPCSRKNIALAFLRASARIRRVGTGIRVWFYPVFHSSEPANGTRPHCRNYRSAGRKKSWNVSSRAVK